MGYPYISSSLSWKLNIKNHHCNSSDPRSALPKVQLPPLQVFAPGSSLHHVSRLSEELIITVLVLAWQIITMSSLSTP